MSYRPNQSWPRISQLYLLVWASLAIMPPAAYGDIFQLKAGGQITGVLVDRGKQGEYIIKADHGALVTLSRRQVDKVVRQDPEDFEYTKRSRALPDTVEAHRELAEWCKKQKRLSQQTQHHLQRILELDPNDKAARLSLGYQQHQGQWMTQDDIMSARGLRHYDHKYRTPQDIALREQTKKREMAEAEWFRKIRLWIGWLDDRRAAEAEAMIANIQDPHAAVAIVKLLERVENPRIRDLLTATLAPLKHSVAVTTLVDFSLDDPDYEVRLQCLEYLLQYHQPISLTPYVKSLRHRDNEIVNRAAEALHRIENPRAISPLIDALVTTHKFNNLDAPPGDINATFAPNGGRGGGASGGGGLSMGGKSKIRKLNLRNLKVRQALVDLSGGQDYEFDENLWRRWFVNEQIQEYVDTRRDQ